MDLATEYRNRRWVALLDYIDQLPRANRLNEAMLNDPEVAAELAERPDPTEPWSPDVRDYNLTAIMMREMISELKVIQQTLVASGGAKPKPFTPFPAPVTELDRVKKRKEREFAVGIAELVGFTESDL